MELAVILKFVAEMISSGNYLGAVITIMMAFLVFLWRKLTKIEKSQQTDHPVSKTDYNKFIEYDGLIAKELEGIRTSVGADRALVLELQNGSYNLGDVATLKVFVRNENLKPSIFSVSPILNGTPASFLNGIFKKIVNGQTSETLSIKSLENEDFGLFQNLTSTNVKSLYAFPLISSEGILYGALVLHFCIEEKSIGKTAIKNLEEDAERLNGEILMLKNMKR